MQFPGVLCILFTFIYLSTALPHEMGENGIFQSESRGNHNLFYQEEMNTSETLVPGDRYSYQRMGNKEDQDAKEAEKQYIKLVDELREFADGAVFRFRDFQSRAAELKQKLGSIHLTEKMHTRYRGLQNYPILILQMMSKMKESAEAMSLWADGYLRGVNLMYELHELRVLALATFDASGFPDVSLPGYRKKVQTLDCKWDLLKAQYENLDETPVHDLFPSILGQVRITIDILLKARDRIPVQSRE